MCVVVVLVTGGSSSLQFSRGARRLKGGPLLQSQEIGGVRSGRGRAQEAATAFQKELQLNSKGSGSLHRVNVGGTIPSDVFLSYYIPFFHPELFLALHRSSQLDCKVED